MSADLEHEELLPSAELLFHPCCFHRFNLLMKMWGGRFELAKDPQRDVLLAAAAWVLCDLYLMQDTLTYIDIN